MMFDDIFFGSEEHGTEPLLDECDGDYKIVEEFFPKRMSLDILYAHSKENEYKVNSGWLCQVRERFKKVLGYYNEEE